MNRFAFTITGIFLFVLTTPALSLTLQEKMALIRQKEQQRKEQIESTHKAKVASQKTVVESKTPKNATPLVVSQEEIESDETKTIAKTKENQTGVANTIAPDQAWEYITNTNWSHRLLINKVEGSKVSAFYTATDKYNNTSASLLEGEFSADQGTLILKFTDYIKGRLPYQLSGKLLNDRLLAKVETGRGLVQWTYNLNKEGSSQFKDTFYFCRSFYEKFEKKREVEKHYQELVINPGFDEHGVKTFETMKLENEKQLLRPLSDAEIETLKQNHTNAVQSAINRKKQQEEQARLAEEKRKQDEAKQARIKAEIAKKEREPLTLFDKFNLADNDIDRDDFKETVIKAGGQFIAPEKQMEILGTTMNDPGIDVFVTSSLLPGTTFGFAQYVTKESLFGTDEVLASFAYILDLAQGESLTKKIEKKYGPPSEEVEETGRSYGVWSRDSGLSALRLEFELTLIPTVMLIYTNIENMKQLDSMAKVQEQKKQSNF